jgi:ubiquinone/menaquinone biosynthesis C-methylase UbiE
MPRSPRYDEVAEFYRESNPDFVAEPVSLALVDLAGPIRGLQVLDLACGAGRMTRELARRGATVTGLDVSRGLLDHARAAETAEPFGIDYVHGDCTAPDALAGRFFDAITSHFGLTDIDDIDGCLATVARVLRPGGTFAFSMLHPCFPGWGAERSASWPPEGGYFREGFWIADGTLSVLRQKVGANHRTLSTYLNALVDHGLAVERLAEPGLPAGWAEARPGADPVPVFLAARCRRA